METQTHTLPDWLLRLEGYVRQFCELQKMETDLSSVLRVPSTEETATHMATRLVMEREIQGRKDYIAEFITLAVIEQFNAAGILSKFPELHTNRSET